MLSLSLAYSNPMDTWGEPHVLYSVDYLTILRLDYGDAKHIYTSSKNSY